MSHILDVDKVILLVTVAIMVFIYARHKPSQKLPPGPKPLPILGNLLDFPTGAAWETYARWSKEYRSGAIHLGLPGTSVVVLNTFEAAMELLDKRSSIYSSRPPFVVLNEVMGWRWLMSTMPYGERWRERRRLFLQHFHINNPKAYQPTQVELIRKMLPQLLETPEDFLAITRHTIGGVAIAMAYGLPIQSRNDPYILAAEEASASLISLNTPAARIMEMLPWLQYVPEWMPGGGFQKTINTCRELQERFRQMPFEAAAARQAAGTAKPSLATSCLGDIDENGDVAHQTEVIIDTAGIIFGAGGDTTLAGVDTILLAMVLYPEVQKKAQAELDRVLGPGRLPEFSDEPDLPYISAIVREALRWGPAAPTGMPHMASEEDVYEGYHIPKGSVIIGNAWAMLHDEDVYPNAATFDPERFIKDGKLDFTGVRDPALIAFGFGRRICPGSHIAISATWLAAASILATFSILEPLDDKGMPIAQKAEFSTGITVRPVDFKCIIKPRSPSATALIQSVADAY